MGMIFYATPDPAHNTTPPTGEFSDSGWQWQGNWIGFTGTAVGSHWFLTARHLGGAVGDAFLLDGETYRTTASFDDPLTDLRLWRVCRPLPTFAPLYADANEEGNVCTLFGRGLARGAEVTVTNAGQVELRGWEWGSGGGALRWGLNLVTGYADYDTQREALLRATFDADGGEEEAMLATGDSGGGVFIRRNERWELAGVALAVDGPFSHVAEGPGFDAALFDRRGLYERDHTNWTLVPSGPQARPAALYATRISVRRDWIESVMTANPEPPPQLVSASTPGGPFEAVSITAGPSAGELRTARPLTSTYYQLSACQPLRMVSVTADGESLVFRYE